MAKSTLSDQLKQQIDNYEKLDEDQQEDMVAESMLKLVDVLPDPSNQKEFEEFMEFLKNPPIHGETEAELVQSFLELSKTNPKLFSQALAFTVLLNDAETLEETVKKLKPKQAKVESISAAELQAIHNEDNQKRIQEIKDELSSIPVD